MCVSGKWWRHEGAAERFRGAFDALTNAANVIVARRTAELHDEVSSATMAQTMSEIVERDAKDSTVVSFQTAADGVVTLDTSALDLEQSIDAVLQIIDVSAKERA